MLGRVLYRVQTHIRRPGSALYAWDIKTTILSSAIQQNYGMAQNREGNPTETTREGWSARTDPHYVSTGSYREDVRVHHTPNGTDAQDVQNPTMEPKHVLVQRRLKGLTPYKPDAWQTELDKHGLSFKYPNLALDLVKGFDIGIPKIFSTYVPPNHPSLFNLLDIHTTIIQKEFDTGRYVGPFTQKELESFIGPFQSLPLSLVLKPGKPGEYRLVHNSSHPHTLTSTNSINSYIDINNFPCTWGTFHAVSLLIFRLPPGSRASVCDVAEAYRTIPVSPEQ